MTENENRVDPKSLLEKRRRNKTEQDDKTDREQLLREIKKLDNNISASRIHPFGKTDEILVDLSDGEYQWVQINSTNWSRIQR